MRRRTFLIGAGGVGTVGAVGLASTLVGSVDVRWWATPRAARHPGLRERVRGYVERGFESIRLSVNVSYGGVTTVPTEDAFRLVADGAWPRRLLSETAGGRLAPVDGVNLLVTDGPIRPGPAGAGVPYVAAVGGASEIVRTPPAVDTEPVVPDRPPMRTVQILLHECGHALGLRHDHGSIRVDGPRAVVSPMISGYAWASGPVRRARLDFEANRCGEPYPSIEGKHRRLRMRFDDCERRGLHRFRRSGLPGSPVDDLSAAELLDSVRPFATCPVCARAGPTGERARCPGPRSVDGGARRDRDDRQ